MTRHDTMQVCVGGHYITDSYRTQPERREDFCSECGKEIIMKCQSCGDEIQGQDLDSSFVRMRPPDPPEFCNNCGSSYPWTDPDADGIDEPEELFDEELVSEAFGHHEREDYQEAVHKAFVVLEERIRNKGGIKQDTVGRDLAQKAFEPESGPLRFGETKSEQAGAMHLYMGAIGIFKNPSSHRLTKHMTENQSYSILCFVNLLLNSIPNPADRPGI